MRLAAISSTSIRCGRTLPWRVAPGQRRCGLKPCRVTNTSEEIYKQMNLKQLEEEELVEVNETQVLYPELGSLESRVTAMYLDELLANKGPDLEETAYWFHTPDEGWRQGLSQLRAAPEVPVTFANPVHIEWQQEGRKPLDELKEGEVITGEISDVWLYHGCQIDFGYQFDGLIPLTEDEWTESDVRDFMMPGDKVVAKVYKIRQPGLYRWPIQLELIEPAHVAAQIMKPSVFEAPISHEWAAEQGWGIEEIVEATGRNYKPGSYLIPQEDAEWARDVQQAFGFDVENEKPEEVMSKFEERAMVQYADYINQLAIQQDMMK